MDDDTRQLSTNLNLFEGNLKRKRLVEVGVQCAFLHRRFLLFDTLSVQHQRQLNVRICSANTNKRYTFAY